MKVVSRPYNIDEDFTAVMTFLYETFKKTSSYQNWFPDRFENNHDEYANDIRIWEEREELITPTNKKIVAVANPETSNVYYIQIDPSYSFIEREIVNWIEKQFFEKKKDPSKKEKLRIRTIEGNSARKLVLSELGYQKEGEIGCYIRIRLKDSPIPDIKYPEGFEIRNVKGKSDYDQLARLIQLIFGHGDWFTAKIWKRFIKRYDEITEKIKSSTAYGISYNKDKTTQEFSFLAGYEIDPGVEVPEGFITFTIPELTYAVVKCTLPTLFKAWNFASEWTAKNGYKDLSCDFGEYEVYPEDYENEERDPMNIYVPIIKA